MFRCPSALACGSTLIFSTRRTGCKMQVDPDSKHIIVMARGQFYWFDVGYFRSLTLLQVS